jgi:hypothetical protein
MDNTKKEELTQKCRLILYDIPVGANSFNDSPVRGNKALAQVVVNRINSIAKNSEEFKFMRDVFINMLKDTRGKEVERIRFDKPVKGITDEKGFLVGADGKKISQSQQRLAKESGLIINPKGD